MTYPKRLIEVDLPIRRISAHARREKSIRHGHISTLHIWWARRPLAACRAVICASLWPDPADDLCPEVFRKVAREQMIKWAENHLKLLSEESYPRFNAISKDASKLDDLVELRRALLDFIADFSNWDNSTVPEFLETSRLLTQTAHEALGGEPGTRPLVVDPFAGGGSIPLEALRVGADAFASDLNPVAVLLNKVVLEYIPKYGKKLADEVRKWGQWVKEQAEKELAEFYPKDPDGATPIAYLWARTVRCEGPGCGAEVPLIRSLWLAKKRSNSVALRMIPRLDAKQMDFEIIENAKAKDVQSGTVKRSSATCPCCGYTTPVDRVRQQMKKRYGGAIDAKLIAVVCTKSGEQGRFYRMPTQNDYRAIDKAKEKLALRVESWRGEDSLVPDEPFPPESAAGAISSSVIFGFRKWGDLFSPRQILALTTLVQLVRDIPYDSKSDFMSAVRTLLAFAIDKQADLGNSLCAWEPNAQCPRHLFGRQAIPMVWDFAEGVVIGESSGSWSVILNGITKALEKMTFKYPAGHVDLMSATKHALPDDSAVCLFTDPPYCRGRFAPSTMVRMRSTHACSARSASQPCGLNRRPSGAPAPL
jgi:adenine-specific DNA methylase